MHSQQARRRARTAAQAVKPDLFLGSRIWLRGLRCFLVTLALASMLDVGAAPAGATAPREYVSSFGAFAKPEDITVDPATGDVYVLDVGSNALYRFDAEGNPAPFAALGTNELTGASGADETPQRGFSFGTFGAEAQVAVDFSGGPANGDVYVTDSNHGFVDIFNADGEYLGQLGGSSAPWGEPCGVAVDPSGDVYVGVYASGGYIDKYKAPASGVISEADYESNIATAEGLCYVAADGESNVYAQTWSTKPATKYAPSQFGAVAPAGVVVSTEAGANIAVDPVHNVFYETQNGTLGSEGRIVERDAAGNSLEAIEAGASASMHGVGVNPSTQRLYVADTFTGRIDVYGTPPPPPAVPPTVASEAVVGVGEQGATLEAHINPERYDTTFQFEYGLDASYGSSVPATPVDIGSGSVSQLVTQPLTNLSPGTTYHYRVVASNVNGVTYGPDRSFSTFAKSRGSVLADGRAWEMVTPQDKNGADLGNALDFYSLPGLTEKIEAPPLHVDSSQDGNTVSFVSNIGAFAKPKSAGLFGQYLSSRGSDGWSTEGIDPPFFPQPDHLLSVNSFVDWNATMADSMLFVQADQPTLSAEAPEGVDSYYLRNTVHGSYRYVGTDAGAYARDPIFGGASADFTHFVFHSNEKALEGHEGLFEAYVGEDGKFHTRLASVLPNGTPIDGHLGGGLAGPTENAISEDGSRVIFTEDPHDRACKESFGEGWISVPLFNSCTATAYQLYVRENGATTRLISGYAPGVPTDAEAGGGQMFWGASSDADRIFFTSQTKLTADSTASHRSGDGFTTGSFGDLYMYELEAEGGKGRLTDIAVDPLDAEGAQVIGVLGVSASGSRVYFVARGTHLAGTHGVAGQANLYVWDDSGATPKLSYITTLQAPAGRSESEAGDVADWVGNSYERASQLTPDGSHLLFSSKNQLTSYDNAGHNEVYVFNAEAGSLACASCGGNEPATADAYVPFSSLPFGASAPTAHVNAISEDGHYVFFTSGQALVAGDTNGTLDAYEYDTLTGKTSLVSSGQSGSPSYFLSATPSGHDVYFLTRQQLVAGDIDENTDIYDARIGGGFPATGEARPPCSSEACHGAPVPVSSEATPASASFQGSGDTTPLAHKHHSRKRHRKASHGRRRDRGRPPHRRRRGRGAAHRGRHGGAGHTSTRKRG